MAADVGAAIADDDDDEMATDDVDEFVAAAAAVALPMTDVLDELAAAVTGWACLRGNRSNC